MKMTVLFLLCAVTLTNANDAFKSDEKVKTYQLEVPGRDPITIIETDDQVPHHWQEVSVDPNRDDVDIKNMMTDIIHDTNGNKPRCYGPSCQESYHDHIGPHESIEGFEEELSEELSKQKDFRDFSKDQLQAITALAAKLKKEKLKSDRYTSVDSDDPDPEDNTNSGKVYTTWNRLKVKQHKHPYDDKDGWVTLEPVAWSTSKISKWKPNVKKPKPSIWSNDNDRFSDEDNKYPSYQTLGTYTYPEKKPTSRPTYINNKLHTTTQEYEAEMPSKPSWNKPQGHYNYPSSWSPDEGRRPGKPICESEDHSVNNNKDQSVYYGLSDSILTDTRPANFPYEYEALHQSSSQKRPLKRPTQVIYAGAPDIEDDRSSRPPFSDGEWVLLSTTKGYRNKKRQRSLSLPFAADDRSDRGSETPSITSHQSIALTVLPVDGRSNRNMTTSHGGLLEVEKSFKTVEESKRDMDKNKKYASVISTNLLKPSGTRVVRKRVVSNVSPDSSTLLAAVGAGMVPATMAMVVPMMLGRRRRRDTTGISEESHLDDIYFRYQ